jgi:hypothetical protein
VWLAAWQQGVNIFPLGLLPGSKEKIFFRVACFGAASDKYFSVGLAAGKRGANIFPRGLLPGSKG